MAKDEVPKLVTESTLHSLTLSLISYDEDVAQFVNPITLYSNRVVDETWICEKGAQIGLTRSSFSYTNGVAVEAIGDTIKFHQQENSAPLDLGSALSPKIALAYADLDPDGWFAASVDFGGVVRLSLESGDPLVSKWPSLLANLGYQGIEPNFGINASYQSNDRRLRAEVRPVAVSTHPYVICVGSVYRQLSQQESEDQRQVASVLNRWRTDWDDVIDVAVSLFTHNLLGGGS